MKKNINVCILDTNRFFVMGIQKILSSAETRGVFYRREGWSSCRSGILIGTKGWPLPWCSSHKRTGICKLGFRRSDEVYHWLRPGGLEQIRRA